MIDYIQAAQSLIAQLGSGVPPQAHSVYIRTEVGEDKEFKRSLCVSVNPKYKGQLNIPDTHMGITVHRVPWPKDMR
jgi:hypothetical protein